MNVYIFEDLNENMRVFSSKKAMFDGLKKELEKFKKPGMMQLWHIGDNNVVMGYNVNDPDTYNIVYDISWKSVKVEG